MGAKVMFDAPRQTSEGGADVGIPSHGIGAHAEPAGWNDQLLANLK